MNLSDNAIKVLEKRYMAKDESGKLIEDAEGMFKRVAKAVAAADSQYVSTEQLKMIEKDFFDMMSNLEFLPNSPTLMNAGRALGQLSACFVLPIEDSMQGIFETIKNAALIHKSGGGTGFSFSRLRSKGSTVNSTGGVASGPISFMKVFNAATEAVKQGGTRRGANMGILRVDHPDIREFITCKQDNNDITNFNISVGITEEFMNAVENKGSYNLVDPKSKEATGKENAEEIFNMIIDNAWNNGEPGIIFLDRLNKDNVVAEVGEIESTNPCGEQPLLPYEACNLGSINLSLMLKSNEHGTEVDYEKLGNTVQKASVKIAESKGVFTYFDKSTYKDDDIRVRNATTTTIAPTGTLSIIAGVSSGIEPLFAISYIRNVMDNEELIEVNPLFRKIAEENGFYSDDLMRRIAEKGTIKGFPEVPENVQHVFVTAHDVSPEYHVKMQAAFQKYTEMGVGTCRCSILVKSKVRKNKKQAGRT